MHLLVVGLNHKTAPLGLREQFAFAGQQLIDTMQTIVKSHGVRGAVLLSTCNRTELYLEAVSLQGVHDWLWQQRGLRLQDLGQYAYFFKNRQAVRHLMQVACGLDSMVLGEVEILGQLKEAYAVATKAGFLSKTLDKLLQSVFATAKKVRTQTEISLNPVSVAYLAVRLAQRIFARISDKKVLIIGAGATAKLLARHLCSAGVQEFTIANRTLAKSQGLAADIAADRLVNYLELFMVPDHLAQVDIVITATAAPLPIVGKGMVERAMKQRKQRSMFMIDLSVPRNIEAQVAEIANVYLYSIDDLQGIAAEHRKIRYNAAHQAELIIAEELDNFMCWLQAQDAVGTIQAFRELCIKQRDQALQIALRQLEAGKDPQQVLQKFAHSLVNKVIHQPTKQMRSASMAGDVELLAVVRRLFKIEEEKV